MKEPFPSEIPQYIDFYYAPLAPLCSRIQFVLFSNLFFVLFCFLLTLHPGSLPFCCQMASQHMFPTSRPYIRSLIFVTILAFSKHCLYIQVVNPSGGLNPSALPLGPSHRGLIQRRRAPCASFSCSDCFVVCFYLDVCFSHFAQRQTKDENGIHQITHKTAHCMINMSGGLLNSIRLLNQTAEPDC